MCAPTAQKGHPLTFFHACKCEIEVEEALYNVFIAVGIVQGDNLFI